MTLPSTRLLNAALLLLVLAIPLGLGCSPKDPKTGEGPAEKAGAKLDDATEDMKEKAGDVSETIKDAAGDIKEDIQGDKESGG